MNIITPPDSAVLFLQTLLHKYSQHAPSRTADVAATAPAVLGSAATDVDALTQSAANGGQQVEGVHRSSARKRGRHHLDAGPQADRPGQLSHRKRNKPCNAADRAEEYLARRVKALQQNKHGLQAAGSTSETATATARTGRSMQAMQAAQKVEHSATCNQATVSAQRMKQLNGCDQVVGQTHQPSDALQPSPSAVPCSALPHQLAAAAVAAGLDAVIQHQLAAEAGLSSASAPPAVPAGCADDSSDELMDLWNAGLQQDNLTPQYDDVFDDDDDDCSGKLHQSNNPTDFRSEHKAAVAPVAAAGCEGHGVQQAVGSGAAAAGDVQLPEQQATVVTREHGHHSGWDTHLMTDVVICPAARQQTQLSTAAAATEDTTAGPEQQQQPPQDATPGPALMFEQPPSVVSFRPPFLPHAIRKTTLKASTTTAAAAESDKRFTLASLLFAVPELPIRQQSEVPQTGRTKQKVKQQPSASTAQSVINSRPVAGLTTGVTVAVSDLTTVAGAGAAATAVGDFLCGAVAKQGPLATRHEAASATAASAVTGKIHAVPLSSDEEGEIADDDQEEDHGGQQQQQQQQDPATAVNNSASAAAMEHPRKRKKSRGGRQVRQRQQRAAAERAAAAASGASGAQGLYAEIKQWEKENNKTRKQQQGVDAARELRFSITEKPPCRFWQLGRCSKGSECPYPHTGQQASKLIACKFHQRGACKLGSECRFSHDDVSRQPCPDLVLYHKCRSVEGGCPYSHQQLEPELAQALRRMLMKMQEEEQQQQHVSAQQFVVTEPGQQQQATGGLVQQQQHQLQTLQHAMYLQAGVGPSWHGQQQLHQIPPGITSQLQQQPVHGMAGHPVNHLYPQHAGQQRPCPQAWSLPGQIMPPS